MNTAEAGQKFVALGRALQDDTTGIRELTDLALACGLQFEFRVVTLEPRSPVSASSEQT